MRTGHVFFVIGLLQALVWFGMAWAWFLLGRDIRRLVRDIQQSEDRRKVR